MDISNLIFYTSARGCATGICVRSTQTRLLTHFAPSSGATKTPDALFKNATFEISIAKPGGLPPPIGAEIAFAGRSNAGKSSAINTLTDHNRLAFVSKTPGRTQLINFFRMQCGAALVDLPGYGYAEVPEKVRLQWQGLLERYLRTRENLIGLVVIMDSRHPLSSSTARCSTGLRRRDDRCMCC